MGKLFSTGVEAFSATTIRITFTHQNERCREPIQLEPTTANLKRAQQHRALILDAISKGTFNYAATFPNSKRAAKFAPTATALTVEDYLNTWLAQQKPRLKTSTWDGYRKILHLLIPPFGATALPELKRTALREWFETKEVSNKTLTNMQSLLRAALQDAVMEELLESNPLFGWKYTRRNPVKTKRHIDPFTTAEQSLILEQLEGQTANLFQFAFWTGLRTSELVALEWGDVDWLKGSVRVQRALTQAADDPEEPKTHAGLRDVKLLPAALEALTRQKQFTALANQHIFHNPRTDKPWPGDNALRQGTWLPALRRAGVRYRNPYQTRHTYASRMLTAGESPMWVAAQMGHSDWTMIAKVYGKWIPDAQPNAGMKAVEMFTQTKEIKNEKPRAS